MIIYKWTNKINGKIYVGQSTKSLKHRTRMHVNSANVGSNLPLHNAIRKYGIENFSQETIATTSNIDELNRYEIEYIKALNSLVPNGYNLKYGGDNHNWHPESKKKASQSAKKRMKADKGEQLKKFREAGQQAVKGKPAWNRGLRASSVTKKKLSESHMGQIAWNKKAIVCNETGEIFESLHAAAATLKLQVGHICSVLKGKRKHTGGYTFSYLS